MAERKVAHAHVSLSPEELARADGSIVFAANGNSLPAAFWVVALALGEPTARTRLTQEVEGLLGTCRTLKTCVGLCVRGLCACVSVFLGAYVPACLGACVCAYVFVCLRACLPACLCAYVPVCLCAYEPAAYVPGCMCVSTCLCACMPV
jgi:hypothetical protein